MYVDFIDIRGDDSFSYNLDCTLFAGPLGFLTGIIRTKAIGVADKIAFIKNIYRLLFQDNKGQTTLELFRSLGFSSTFIDRI